MITHIAIFDGMRLEVNNFGLPNRDAWINGFSITPPVITLWTKLPFNDISLSYVFCVHSHCFMIIISVWSMIHKPWFKISFRNHCVPCVFITLFKWQIVSKLPGTMTAITIKNNEEYGNNNYSHVVCATIMIKHAANAMLVAKGHGTMSFTNFCQC